MKGDSEYPYYYEPKCGYVDKLIYVVAEPYSKRVENYISVYNVVNYTLTGE